MKPHELTPIAAFVKNADLTDALKTPGTSLEDNTLLTDAQGRQYFLPGYELAAQAASGVRAFDIALSPEGLLTIPLKTVPPVELAGSVRGADPFTSRTSVQLFCDYEGSTRKWPLDLKEKGGIWYATLQTSDESNLQALRVVLHQQVPAAALIVRRQAKLAARLTREFVTAWWDNSEVQKQLLARFGTMTFPSAEMYYKMVERTYPSTKDEYLIFECVYQNRLQCPRIPGVTQVPLTYSGVTYNYYHDDLERRRVYFLPDEFRLASSAAGPEASFLKFESEDGTIGGMNVTFEFCAEPMFNAAPTGEKTRLEAARAELTTKLKQTPEMLSVQNAKGVATALFLYIPSAEGRESTREKIPKADINLGKEIKGQITLTFKAFKTVWDAIFSKRNEQQIFTGEIEVKLEDGTYLEKVPVKLRLERLEEQNYYKLLRPTAFSYKREIAVKASRAIFENGTVEALEVSFDDDENAKVDFDASDLQGPKKTYLEKNVTVQRTVSSVLLGTTEPDGYNSYKSKVKVVPSSGPAKTKVMTSDGTILRIRPADINE